jgi:hypothetical protein
VKEGAARTRQFRAAPSFVSYLPANNRFTAASTSRYVAINLLVDVLYVVLDPRIKY